MKFHCGFAVDLFKNCNFTRRLFHNLYDGILILRFAGCNFSDVNKSSFSFKNEVKSINNSQKDLSSIYLTCSLNYFFFCVCVCIKKKDFNQISLCLLLFFFFISSRKSTLLILLFQHPKLPSNLNNRVCIDFRE